MRDKITAVTEGEKLLRSFTYHMAGQIASATRADGRRESDLWDGAVRRPAAVAGTLREPVPQSPSGLMIHYNSTESTGKPLIGDLGYAFLFRNYRAEQGKWQTADPIAMIPPISTYGREDIELEKSNLVTTLGFPDGWNHFAYANNEVVDSIDFQGTKTITVTFRHTITVPYGKQDQLYDIIQLTLANDVASLSKYKNVSSPNIKQSDWISYPKKVDGVPQSGTYLLIATITY